MLAQVCVLSLTMSHSWEQVRSDVMHHSTAHDVTRHWFVFGVGPLEQDRFRRSRMINLRFESRLSIECMSVPAYIINDILIVLSNTRICMQFILTMVVKTAPIECEQHGIGHGARMVC